MGRLLILLISIGMAGLVIGCGRLPDEGAVPTSTTANPFGATQATEEVDLSGVVVQSDETVAAVDAEPAVEPNTTDIGPAAPAPDNEDQTAPDVPPSTTPETITPEPEPQPNPVVPDSSASNTHVVAAGETLSTIAEQYGVSTSALTESNGLSDADAITEGQELRIP